MEEFTKIIFQIILFSSFINLITSENVAAPPQEISKCNFTQPIKDIKDICYDEISDENLDKRYRCCYVEVKFKYNTYVMCNLVDIEDVNMRDVIKNLSIEYQVNSKSIKIDCNNTFIKLSLIFVIIFFII